MALNAMKKTKQKRKKRQSFARYPNPSGLAAGAEIDMAADADPICRAFFTLCEQRCIPICKALADSAPFNGGKPHSVAITRNMRAGRPQPVDNVRHMFQAIGCDLAITQVAAPQITNKHPNVPGLKTLMKPKQWPKAHPWVQELTNIIYYHNLKYNDVYRTAGVSLNTFHKWQKGGTPWLKHFRAMLTVLGCDFAIVPLQKK